MLSDAPELPDFISRRFPVRRRMFEIPEGIDAGRRIHFVDHGEGQPVWMQHGNPTWSFLWRKVIDRLDTSAIRVIAPDMLGLGLSSKLPHPDDHRLQRHLDSMCALFDALELESVVVVGQDMGGPIAAGVGLHAGARTTGAVFANTSIRAPRRPRGTAFHRFSRLPLISPLVFRVLGFPQNVMSRAQGDPSSMRGVVGRAYRWPLRRYADRAAPLGLARMVPSSPEHPSMAPLREIDAWARAFAGPVELVWGLRDPILGRQLKRHQEMFPDARVTETQAGHFLQEEVPDELAAAITRVVSQV